MDKVHAAGMLGEEIGRFAQRVDEGEMPVLALQQFTGGAIAHGIGQDREADLGRRLRDRNRAVSAPATARHRLHPQQHPGTTGAYRESSRPDPGGT